MRIRVFWSTMLFLLLLIIPASADIITFGTMHYVYPDGVALSPTLYLHVQGESLNRETFEIAKDPMLSGAVFGIYTKDASGGFVPYPNPSDPSRPWRLTVGTVALPVVMPASVDLYIKQESAPEGFVPSDEAEGYTRLEPHGEITFTNFQADMESILIRLTADDATGPMPLQGIEFIVDGMDTSLALVTDENGFATVFGIEPGDYTVRQQSTIDGFYIDEPEIQITVEKHAPVRLDIRNSRDGHIILQVNGGMVDGTFKTQYTPIARRYEIFDENHTSLGVLSNGETMIVPASQEGKIYTAKAVDTPNDGFCPDTHEHEVTVYSGKTEFFQILVPGNKGFFVLSHISAEDGEPVSGGRFTLYDQYENDVLAFEADSNGQYMPLTPLPSGAYTIRMTYAADGYQYSGESLGIEIDPYTQDDKPILQVSMESEPIPDAMLSPYVAADAKELQSLFEADAEIDFTLSLLGAEPVLPVKDVEYEFDLPDIKGLTAIGRKEDGAHMTIARRLPLFGAEEIQSVEVSGVVRFAFEYPVSKDSVKEMAVEAPFTSTVATFEKADDDYEFAVTGHVMDRAGNAIAGMRVMLEDESGALLFSETHTDPFGAYAFEKEPEGAIVRFETPPGYGVRLEAAEAMLLPLQVFTGRVMIHGEIEGYPVTISYGDMREQTPDENGNISFSGIFSDEDELIIDTPEDVLSKVEAVKGGAIIHLYQAGSVTGLALDSDEKAVANVSVTLTGPDATQTTQSDADGVFSFGSLLPGSYSLSFVAPEGYLFINDGVRGVVLGTGEQKTAQAARFVRPGRIEGVIAEAGVGMEAVEVTLQPSGAKAKTDDEGRFAFGDLYTGAYALTFDMRDDMLLSNPPGEITLATPGEQVELTLSAVRPATITGRVWQDANDDGLCTANEAGLREARVTLLSAEDAEVAAETTNEDGYYSFTGLLPGDYRLRVQLPESMMFAKEAPEEERLIEGLNAREAESGTLAVASGETLETPLCGATRAGAISGVMWEDINQDGYYDPEEPLLENVEITLLENEVVVFETASDAEGAYRIENLRPAAYTIRLALPEGYIYTVQRQGGEAIGSTAPSADDRIATLAVMIEPNELEHFVHAGSQPTVRIEARAWLDEDGDGNEWNEEGSSDIQVNLYALIGSEERLVGSERTDAEGGASFAGLRSGSYRLSYSLPSEAEWGFTSGVERSGNGIGYGPVMAFEGTETVQAAAVGITKLGSIEGRVFVDEDYDGLRKEEGSVVAASITLLNAAGGVITETKTAPDGSYAITGLRPGNYMVRFEVSQGYAFTCNKPDAPSYNSDVPEISDHIGETVVLHLPIGETLLVDAGVYRTGSIAGAVWHDARGNGLYSSGNAPLPGLEVAIMRGTEVYGDRMTDEAGAYGFEGLPPGEYAIRVTLPEGMHFTVQSYAEGRASLIMPTEGNVGKTTAFTLAMGERKTEIDAGAVYTGAVSGRVYEMNSDHGLPDIGVTITQNGVVIGETTTDETGRYILENLMPGSAKVHFSPPLEWLFEQGNEGIIEMNIPQRSTAENVDIFLLPQTVIEGTLWIDANYDGIHQEDEDPLESALVVLRKHQTQEEENQEGDIISVSGADAGGKFWFNRLQPGYYSIRVVPPDGMLMYSGEESSIVSLDMGEVVTITGPAYIASFIRGVVWNDIDGDGELSEDEPLLEGVQVELIDQDGTVLLDKETDSDGVYLFNELPPLRCYVKMTLPEGYIFTAAKDGRSRIVDSTANIGTTELLTFSMGSTLMNMDGGAVMPGRIGDIVWLDENGNGLQETSESGVAGLQVTLLRKDKDGSLSIARETTTDQNGRYRFDEILPGQYQVAIALGDAYVPTKPFDGLAEISSKLRWAAEESPTTDEFSLQSGEYVLNIDAGIVEMDKIESLGWRIGNDGVITD